MRTTTTLHTILPMPGHRWRTHSTRLPDWEEFTLTSMSRSFQILELLPFAFDNSELFSEQ